MLCSHFNTCGHQYQGTARKLVTTQWVVGESTVLGPHPPAGCPWPVAGSQMQRRMNAKKENERERRTVKGNMLVCEATDCNYEARRAARTREKLPQNRWGAATIGALVKAMAGRGTRPPGYVKTAGSITKKSRCRSPAPLASGRIRHCSRLLLRLPGLRFGHHTVQLSPGANGFQLLQKHAARAMSCGCTYRGSGWHGCAWESCRSAGVGTKLQVSGAEEVEWQQWLGNGPALKGHSPAAPRTAQMGLLRTCNQCPVTKNHRHTQAG